MTVARCRLVVASLAALFAAAGGMVHLPASASGRSTQGIPPPGLPQDGAQFGAYIQVDCVWSGCTRVEAQENVERDQALRQFALDRQFYLWDDDWPTADDELSASQGRTLVLSWDPITNDQHIIRWADIASGVYDAELDAQAAKIKAFRHPFWFVFHHEPQNDPPGGGHFGDPSDFVAAWQHVHERFDADGVTNIRWLLVLFARTFSGPAADAYYPGDRWVDAIGADGYNWYLCGGPWKTFESVFTDFHAWGVGHQKPMIIAEYGTGEDPEDPTRKATWFYPDTLNTLKGWPEVKAVAYYDTGKNPLCLRWINTSPESQAAFAELGADPYFYPGPDRTRPTTTIDSGPPAQTFDTTATFTWSSDEFDVRYVCTLDGAPATPCYDFTQTVTGLAPGEHTFGVQATDYSNNKGASAEWDWTVVPTTVGVSVTDGGFLPQSSQLVQGQSVDWSVDPGAALLHQIADATGMGLFASDVLSAGDSYAFQFVAAGSYSYRDGLHPTLTGKVQVPMVVDPATGTTTTVFTVTWAYADPPAGYAVDVQIQRPGAGWKNWRKGQAGTSTTFVPDAGSGTYAFRARLRSLGNGAASDYSSPFTIVVDPSS